MKSMKRWLYRTKLDWWLSTAGRRGGIGGLNGFFWSNENVLKWIVVVVGKSVEYVESHSRWVSCTECEFQYISRISANWEWPCWILTVVSFQGAKYCCCHHLLVSGIGIQLRALGTSAPGNTDTCQQTACFTRYLPFGLSSALVTGLVWLNNLTSYKSRPPYSMLLVMKLYSIQENLIVMPCFQRWERSCLHLWNAIDR